MLMMVILNSLVVIVSVMIHYEFLRVMADKLIGWTANRHLIIVLGVFGSLIAHAIEVWVFAIAYYWMHYAGAWGQLEGQFDGSLLACSYFSFTTYTTLGLGDITPMGDIRYLTGIESLTGLVLISWTASFLFIEMQKHWALR